MANRVTCRFFQVQKKETDAPSFGHALKSVYSLKSPKDRTKTVDDTAIRLERFNDSGKDISCEVVRIESENLPSEVTDSGLDALDAERIGYGVAFCYTPSLSVLSLQYDNRLVSGTKICQYLAQFDPSHAYFLKAIPGPDLWTEFSNSQVKRFTIRLAAPKVFDSQFGSEIEQSISGLAKAYDSPFITIGLSVGRKKASLADSLKNAVSKILTSYDVETMKAKLVESPEEIDLLEDLLSVKGQIKIPNDPVGSYKARIKFVQRSLDSKRNYLSKVSVGT